MTDTSANIVGILLAAGVGSRFGGDKLAYPMPDGVAIAAHAARNMLAAGIPVTAVVRPGDFPLAELLEQEGCFVTVCPGAARGMGASLAHAVRTERDAGGWVIAPADMPKISPATVTAVVAALAQGSLIAAPVFEHQRGHPVGFNRELRGELLALDGDEGARGILERHRDRMKLIECDDAGTLYDVDRRNDITL